MRLAYHPALGKVRYSVRSLPNAPDAQVGQTAGLMLERIASDSEHPWFANRARSITGEGGWQDRCHRAWAHTSAAIKFLRDEEITSSLPVGDVIEAIIRPLDMARYVDQGIAIGDCDDFTMYLAALLSASGIPCGLCALAADHRVPDQYSHIYVVAYPEPGVRVPLDASHGEYPGWEYPNLYGKRCEWRVQSENTLKLFSLAGLAALGLIGWSAGKEMFA